MVATLTKFIHFESFVQKASNLTIFHLFRSLSLSLFWGGGGRRVVEQVGAKQIYMRYSDPDAKEFQAF